MKPKKMIKHKIYKEPTDEQKKELYKFYEIIFDSDFTLTKKRSLITAVLSYETWSWRVVGVTEEAIKSIARNNFNKPNKTLARDHSVSRVETYNKVFEVKMPFKDWWKLIWENDKTTLMTNKEHQVIKTKPPSKIYPINPFDNYFIGAGLIGWHQTKSREGAFIKALCVQHNIDY
jgi:hypothetical protein